MVAIKPRPCTMAVARLILSAVVTDTPSRLSFGIHPKHVRQGCSGSEPLCGIHERLFQNIATNKFGDTSAAPQGCSPVTLGSELVTRSRMLSKGISAPFGLQDSQDSMSCSALCSVATSASTTICCSGVGSKESHGMGGFYQCGLVLIQPVGFVCSS